MGNKFKNMCRKFLLKKQKSELKKKSLKPTEDNGNNELFYKE
jgi:hypothetical protein